MEEILKIILSEQWAIMGLFVLTLLGIYKLAKWFGASYLKLQADHNTAFLKSFDAMIDKISTGDALHSDEHEMLLKTIWDRHDKNNTQHELMIVMIKENTDNIKMTHNSIENLNNLIKKEAL